MQYLYMKYFETYEVAFYQNDGKAQKQGFCDEVKIK